MSNEKANIEVYCLSYFYSKPDHREKLINSLLALIAPTRAEKGCLQYDLLIDKDDPNLLIMLEKFSNLKALKNMSKCLM
ncbi:MAG: antibiotic biosynthesis monooxygenase [Coxiellaceae bacterium]|nr:MAG: antibiotic biosynthesis monooxygenase [Coxiellaceae bacterium]